MVDNSRNSLAKLVSQVQQLQTVERMLAQSDGTTVASIAAAVGCTPRHARRLIGALKELGCSVTDDFVVGTREAATFKLKKATQLFKR